MPTTTVNPLRRSLHGFYLVEVLIGATLLGIAISSVALLARSSDRAYRTGAMASQLESRTTQTVERVLSELRIAGLSSLTPDPVAGLGGDSVQYLQALDLVSGEIRWSAPRRLAFVYEQGELDDGLDNNGNGLVDEGVLVLTENAGTANERDIVLTRWVREYQRGEFDNGLDDDGDGLVDERGFFVERNDETITIQLTLERVDADGNSLVRSSRTSTRLRN